jgi:hypothetical protein
MRLVELYVSYGVASSYVNAHVLVVDGGWLVRRQWIVRSIYDHHLLLYGEHDITKIKP